MSLAVGPISQVSVSSNQCALTCAAATGGTGPYTYQWYMSTTDSFSPGSGNIVSGAISLSETFTGLIPNVTYYFVVIVTDTGNSNTTADSAQFTLVTTPTQLSQNQFGLQSIVGTVDQAYNYNTHSVQIDSTQATALYAGQPVKRVTTQTSTNSIPKVVACSASSDVVFGFINYDIKSVSFPALATAEISCSGNVMYLYATGAINSGAQVVLDLANGGVAQIGSSGAQIVGWAYDGATARGQLIRVFLTTPTYSVD